MHLIHVQICLKTTIGKVNSINNDHIPMVSLVLLLAVDTTHGVVSRMLFPPFDSQILPYLAPPLGLFFLRFVSKLFFPCLTRNVDFLQISIQDLLYPLLFSLWVGSVSHCSTKRTWSPYSLRTTCLLSYIATFFLLNMFFKLALSNGPWIFQFTRPLFIHCLYCAY